MVRDGDELLATRLPSIMVGKSPKIPDVGDQAPAVHTPTVDEVGDVAKIDTRDPHDTMHDTDLADVIGQEPVVLLFATPALCVSRVCGPVVDVAEQVKSEVGDDAAFIHMEVYNGNDPNEGIRPQLVDYGLKTEPWLFVLDAEGKRRRSDRGRLQRQRAPRRARRRRRLAALDVQGPATASATAGCVRIPAMTIGTGLVLIAVGAIMRFAVKDTWDAVDIPTVGLILMVVGAIGFVVGLFMAFDRRPGDPPPPPPRV